MNSYINLDWSKNRHTYLVNKRLDKNKFNNMPYQLLL